MDLNGLGARLRKARRDKGLSIQDLARLADVDPAHVSRIETGKVVPTAKRARRGALPQIAAALGLALEDLLGDGGPSLRALPGGERAVLAEEVALREMELFLRRECGDVWALMGKLHNREVLMAQLKGHIATWADLIRAEARIRRRMK